MERRVVEDHGVRVSGTKPQEGPDGTEAKSLQCEVEGEGGVACGEGAAHDGGVGQSVRCACELGEPVEASARGRGRDVVRERLGGAEGRRAGDGGVVRADRSLEDAVGVAQKKSCRGRVTGVAV